MVGAARNLVAAATDACPRQQLDEPSRNALHLWRCPASAGQSGDRSRQLIGCGFIGKVGQSSRLVPWIKAQPRQGRQDAQRHPIDLLTDGGEQKRVQFWKHRRVRTTQGHQNELPVPGTSHA
jgi:hypothetical protein